MLSDGGILPKELDVNLSDLLGEIFESDSNHELLQVLPVTCALALGSHRWGKTKFYPGAETFDGNEHCIMTAAIFLLGGALDGRTAGIMDNESDNGSNNRLEAVHRCEEFLDRATAAVLRHCASKNNDTKRLGYEMVTMLDRFTKDCPLVGAGRIERFLPFALRQSYKSHIIEDFYK